MESSASSEELEPNNASQYMEAATTDNGGLLLKKTDKEHNAEVGGTFESIEAWEARFQERVHLVNGGNHPQHESKNWVQILNEVIQANALPLPTYQIYEIPQQLGSNFAYECFISGLREEPFGGRDKIFFTKKAAKSSAAQEACLWLREHSYLAGANLSGSLFYSSIAPGPSSNAFPNGPPAIASASAILKGLRKTTANMSPTKALPIYCKELRLPTPQYKIVQELFRSIPLFSASVSLPSETRLPQPMGEVSRIQGRGRAKEECARQALIALMRWGVTH